MTVVSKASTTWIGALTAGSGTVTFATSSTGALPVDWQARSEGSSTTTTPEELIAAAHASCFSMALSHALAENSTPPERIDTGAAVSFQPGVGITGSHLQVSAAVPGIAPEEFQRIAAEAKAGCPVSQALAGVEVTLEATLV